MGAGPLMDMGYMMIPVVVMVVIMIVVAVSSSAYDQQHSQHKESEVEPHF